MGDEDLVRSAGFVLMGRRSPGLCSERLEEQRREERRTDLGPWGKLLLSAAAGSFGGRRL